MVDHLSEDGARVDYSALRISPAFAKFCDVAGKLPRPAGVDAGCDGWPRWTSARPFGSTSTTAS